MTSDEPRNQRAKPGQAGSKLRQGETAQATETTDDGGFVRCDEVSGHWVGAVERVVQVHEAVGYDGKVALDKRLSGFVEGRVGVAEDFH